MASLSPAAAAGFAALLVLCWCGTGCLAAPPPAMYVFGDSLMDVGNNNYLRSSNIIKANLPYNGIDYPSHKPNGRFCNGKNTADSLAEKLGLVSPPAYLSLPSDSNNTDAFLGGLNFASGGAGTFDSTFKGQCLSMNNQIDNYTTVHEALVKQLGDNTTQTYLSVSIFAVVIGSNDIFTYVRSDPATRNTTGQQYVDSMIASLQGQLKTIYKLGARKLAVIGTGPIGCSPDQRHQSKAGDCSVEANFLASQFNKGASSMLEQLEAQLSGLSYSFFDTYSAVTDIINDPSSYGFVEIKAACCGRGYLNARIPCTPFSNLCSNRSDHVFWDPYHPTEAAVGKLTSAAFDGSEGYAYPMTIKQLAAM